MNNMINNVNKKEISTAQIRAIWQVIYWVYIDSIIDSQFDYYSDFYNEVDYAPCLMGEKKYYRIVQEMHDLIGDEIITMKVIDGILKQCAVNFEFKGTIGLGEFNYPKTVRLIPLFEGEGFIITDEPFYRNKENEFFVQKARQICLAIGQKTTFKNIERWIPFFDYKQLIEDLDPNRGYWDYEKDRYNPTFVEYIDQEIVKEKEELQKKYASEKRKIEKIIRRLNKLSRR